MSDKLVEKNTKIRILRKRKKRNMEKNLIFVKAFLGGYLR